MSCPFRYMNQKIEINSSVKNSDFFKSHSVNDWTFKKFYSWSNGQMVNRVKTKLYQYKCSLNSLRKKQQLDDDLLSYVGSLFDKKVGLVFSVKIRKNI
jgi:hypothetical protein